MIRAGVFIGVDKTGGLQRLHDAAAGAERMYRWALGQGMAERTHAKLVTDADGRRVTPDGIYDAIKEILDGPGVDQLIVYFAGHGVNINRSEHWLLTEAPARTSAAVNVSGSVELARYCGIRHVVIMSDACRVAPEGIQAQNVRGIDIFPNEGAADRAQPVDQFFACVLGRTAAEIRDPAVAAGTFSALYTEVLLDALRGTDTEVLEPPTPADEGAHYVKPVRLKEYLEAEVPRRVQALNLQHKVNQAPDAIVTAHPYWISRVTTVEASSRPAPAVRRAGRSGVADTADGTIRRIIHAAAEGGRGSRLDREISRVSDSKFEAARRLAEAIEHVAAPFAPDRFETGCGIKVRGARIVEHFAPHARAAALGSSGDLLQVDGVARGAASVLLKFAGDFGTVIPAIPGFVAGLTIEDGSLIDVAYEPSANTPRWGLYKNRASEARTVRAVAAAASQDGRFHLEKDDAVSIGQQMRYEKGVDLTLALYTAYAYNDTQDTARIEQMADDLVGDVGFLPFDVALLARRLAGRRLDTDSGVVPFVPLLARGWALLGANRVRLHPSLDGIERSIRDSQWSLFDGGGLESLRRALASGEVR
jgi:hypothetical protein